MVLTVIPCRGCGKYLGQSDIVCEHKENGKPVPYCRKCNKKYPAFEMALKEAWRECKDKMDKIREDLSAQFFVKEYEVDEEFKDSERYAKEEYDKTISEIRRLQRHADNMKKAQLERKAAIENSRTETPQQAPTDKPLSKDELVERGQLVTGEGQPNIDTGELAVDPSEIPIKEEDVI